jgi:hypothetical protein
MVVSAFFVFEKFIGQPSLTQRKALLRILQQADAKRTIIGTVPRNQIITCSKSDQSVMIFEHNAIKTVTINRVVI